MSNVEWSAYIEIPGVDKPTLLSPLRWKGSDQVSNLIAMIKFFQEHQMDEKTKILIYKSCCGSGKCCEKDTLILTNKGILRIEDMVKGNRVARKTIEESFGIDIPIDNKDQYIGSTVKSLNLGNVKIENDIISNMFDMGENDIIDITTNSGFNIKCTPTHKLIIIDDNCDIVFKEAKDISIGDNIAVVCGTEIYGEDVDTLGFYQSGSYRRHKTNFKEIVVPIKMNEDIAELLGYIISEGNDSNERVITITNDEKIIRDRIDIIVKTLEISSSEIFGYERNIYDGNSICSSMFYDFMIYLGYIGGSKNKEVPWSILQSSKKVQIAFLKALFSGDGYIGNENTNHIEYYTTSKKMAEQLHIMLLNMSIFSSLREKDAICTKKDGERKDCGICYRIAISGRYDIIKYINLIGFIQDDKKSRCIELLDRLESKEKSGITSYQPRTVNGSYIRLKRIYEEFKKLGKNRKIIKVWNEEIDLGNKKWNVARHRELSACAAIIDRGLKTGNIVEWTNGAHSASKRQILKLLKIMKECYYMEDFIYLYKIVTSNIEFDTVENKKTGKSCVYDLTIRDNHSYIGNGFINHNSLTLLHVPKEMEGRAIIVTPFRNLQRQYYDDYFKGNKFVMKKDGTKLKVSVFLGRNNFKCRWLEEQYDFQQKIIEANKNFDQSMSVDDNILKSYQIDNTVANRFLPCTRTLRSIGAGRREARYAAASTCLHPNTDILTPDGIKKIRDINIGDRIYSMNIEQMCVEIDVVTNKKKNYAESLIRFHNTGTGCDIRTTYNHTMIYKRADTSITIHNGPASELIKNLTDDVVFIKPHNIVHNKDYIDKIKIVNKSYDTNDFLTLLGWYISEGWMVKKDITSYADTDQKYDLSIGKLKIRARYCYCKIAQSPTENNEHFDDIANLLDKMKIRYHFDGYWSFVITDSNVANALIYYGGKKSKDKFIHKDIFNYPKEQLKYMFESLLKGDGSIMPTKGSAPYRYSTISRNLINDIAFLSNILGYRTSISTNIGVHTIYVSTFGGIYAGKIKFDKLNHRGNVHDIEVEKNHNYFAGDNGKFILVHNCQYWIPPPMTKGVIGSWAESSDGDIEVSYSTDVGLNEQQETENQQVIDGKLSRLDKIKAKIKCSKIEYYESVGQGPMGIFIRDEKDKDGKLCPDVCPYYKQFYSYIESDVIVFNSAKWKLETMMERKPKVNVEIIDEGDYWIDSQATTVELMRSTIDKVFPTGNKMKHLKMSTLSEFDMYFRKIKADIEKSKQSDIGIVDTKDYKELFYMIETFLEEYQKQTEDDDTVEQKLIDIDIVRKYADVASLSYMEGRREETRIIKVYVPYPDKLLKDIFNLSSKNIILTSGTMHSTFVLSSLFGINNDNYIIDILNGRREHPGKLKCIRPPKYNPLNMVKVTYTSWQSPQFREYYTRVLNYILDQLKMGIDKHTGKPGEAKIILLTPAKKYVEGILKRPDVFVDFAKTRSQYEDDIKPSVDTNLSDYVDNTLADIRKIKSTDIELNGDVLRTDKQIIVSTRMIRGTDLKDNKCRAIVMAKWPVGDISDGYLQAIKKRFGEKVFWEIVRDRAAREAVQYVSRGLRHEADWTFFATVDLIAFDHVFRLFSYD